MAEGEATVAIGMPVFNGERHLEATLESLQAQTLSSWHLLVSDNASTDGTVDLVREIASNDPRVTLLANEVNRGAVWNYNNAFEASPPAPFFMWLSADDLIDPDYLERLVGVLQRDADAIGVYSGAIRIDGEGAQTGNFDRALERLNLALPSAFQRHRRALLGMPGIAIFGLFRRDVMAASGLHYSCVGGDRVFMCDMALRGRIVSIPDRLFVRREHEHQFSGGGLSAKERSDFMGVASNANEMLLRLRTHLGVIAASEAAPVTKLRCYASVVIEFPLLLAGLRVRARLARRA